MSAILLLISFIVRLRIMNLKPLYTKVILKTEEPQTQTASGIFLPDTTDAKSYTAKVVAVGEGSLNEDGDVVPLPLKVNQRVIIGGNWTGEDVTVEGIEYKIVDIKDILAVIE